jgi:hypothetical protein
LSRSGGVSAISPIRPIVPTRRAGGTTIRTRLGLLALLEGLATTGWSMARRPGRYFGQCCRPRLKFASKLTHTCGGHECGRLRNRFVFGSSSRIRPTTLIDFRDGTGIVRFCWLSVRLGLRDGLCLRGAAPGGESVRFAGKRLWVGIGAAVLVTQTGVTPLPTSARTCWLTRGGLQALTRHRRRR